MTLFRDKGSWLLYDVDRIGCVHKPEIRAKNIR